MPTRPGPTDPALLAGIAGLLAQPAAAGADGCVHGRITPAGPPGQRPASVLIGPGPRPGDGRCAPCALVLVAGVELFTYIWLAACMGVAFLGKVTESTRLGRVLGPLFVYLGGYGPLLCAITTAAYLKELQHAEVRWDKTEKTGKVAAPT